MHVPVVWFTGRLWLQVQGTLSSKGSKFYLNEALHIFPTLSKRLGEDKPKCTILIENIFPFASQDKTLLKTVSRLPSLASASWIQDLFSNNSFYLFDLFFNTVNLFFSIFTCRGFIFMIDWVSSQCQAWHDPWKSLMWHDRQTAQPEKSKKKISKWPFLKHRQKNT